MNKLICILLLMSDCQKSFAGDVQVHPLKPGVPTDEFEKAGFKVHQYRSKGSMLPFDRAHREDWLKRAGLTASVQKWDDLEKDLIVVRSRTLDEKRFIATYTDKNLGDSNLKDLRKITAKEGKW